MNPEAAPIVIVGAGQAAARAARALRDQGCTQPIAMVGAEAHLPYERPPLSKGVLCDETEPATAVLPPAQFADCRLDFRTGVRAVELDRAQRRIQLSDGRSLTYSQCLLATGGQARVLPALAPGMPRVHYLRTLDDARRLRSVLQPDKRLAVIGGGFLGLEAAASARRRGAEVTVVETAAALLARFVPPEVSGWLADEARRSGIGLRLGTAVEAVDVDADRVQITLADGIVVQADEVLVAIGLLPDTTLAEAAGLAIHGRHGGILVDAACRSSDPFVFAAGDCASQRRSHLGETLRLESWQNANAQAAAAAAGLMGLEPPPQAYPWFWTDQAQHNLQMLGLPASDLAYVRRGELATASTALWIGHRRGIPVHGIALNAGADLRALRPLFERGLAIDIDRFTAPGLSLRAFAKDMLAAAAPQAGR